MKFCHLQQHGPWGYYAKEISHTNTHTIWFQLYEGYFLIKQMNKPNKIYRGKIGVCQRGGGLRQGRGGEGNQAV